MRYLILVAALAISGCGGESLVDENEKPLVEVGEDDQEMNAAMAKARESIEKFLTAFQDQGSTFSGMLKVRFEDPDNNSVEHMWVVLNGVDGDVFNGTLVSRPAQIESLREGGKVDFNLSDISDWLYPEGGKAVGAFTVNVLRSRMSADERKSHDSGYPFSF